MNEIKVFSPSFTKVWDRCPIKTTFERSMKLSPAYADRPLYARIAGTAFHAGAATLHRQKQIGVPIEIAPALEVLKGTFEEHWNAYHQAGGHTEAKEIESSLLIVGNTLTKYAKDPQSPLVRWQSITDVELVLPNAGHCRLDLVGTNALGIPTIADIKYKKELKAELETKTYNQFRGDWQLSHYKTFLPQHRQDGPADYDTEIILVVAGPRYRILEWPVPSLSQKNFQEAATPIWIDMANKKGYLTTELSMPTTHEDQYGICPFLRTCLDLDRDPMQDQVTPFITVEWPRNLDD